MEREQCRDVTRPFLQGTEMAVSIRDARRSREDREWIERVYREYLVDLAAGGTGVFPALAVTGQATQELLGTWFRDDKSVPFVILRGAEPAGFALVQRTSAAPHGPQAAHRLTEFFIRRPFRRRGLGREAAMLLFRRFEGQWLVSESMRNRDAVAFWRNVIGGYTHGRYRERQAGGEIQHTFASASRGRAE
jgi:predicted acetyltransferase